MVATERPARTGRRVLLVEDDEAVRMTLRYNLAAKGHVVSEAATGTEGLQRARDCVYPSAF